MLVKKSILLFCDKAKAAFAAFACSQLNFFSKMIFVKSAERAFKIRGKVFEFCAGCNAVLGCAERFVIYPAAYFTYIFFHDLQFLSF